LSTQTGKITGLECAFSLSTCSNIFLLEGLLDYTVNNIIVKRANKKVGNVMRDFHETVKLIKSLERDIINNIKREQIAVYKFLQQEFAKGDITLNYLFQFVFRTFYRIDSAGLTDNFKREYFKIMEEKRFSDILDPQEIVLRLYPFKRIKGDQSIQFSFTTKLIHTINVDFPIYDSEVAKVFQFTTYYIPNVERKVARYLEQHKIIVEVYEKILKDNLLKNTFQLFENKFVDSKLPDIKKLDFIIWSCGKII